MTDNRKPGPVGPSIHEAPTLPDRAAVPQPQPPRQEPSSRPRTPVTNVELMDAIANMSRTTAVAIGDLTRELRFTREDVQGVESKVQEVKGEVQGVKGELHGVVRRVDILEKGGIPAIRPRAPSLSSMREEDVSDSLRGLSPDEQNTVVAKGIIRNRRQTNTQTGVIVAGLIALGAAATQFISAQAERTRTETAQLQRQLAHDAAEAAAKAAAEAAKKAAP